MDKKFIIIKKTDGFTSVGEYYGKISISHLSKEHLCWDCKNARPDKCLKIQYIKKNIEKYPFITDGFQIVDNETNTLDSFVVTGCTTFEKDDVQQEQNTSNDTPQKLDIKQEKSTSKVLTRKKEENLSPRELYNRGLLKR